MTPWRQRPWVLAGLLLIAAAALGTSMRSWWGPSAVAGVVLLHLLAGFTLQHPPRTFTGLVLAVPFALWWRQAFLSQQAYYTPAYILMIIGSYTVALGTYHLLTAAHGGRRTHALFGAVFAFAIAGTVRTNPFYLPLLALFLPLVVAAMRQHLGLAGRRTQPARWWARTALYALALLGLTVVIQKGLVERGDSFDRYLMRLMMRGHGSSSAGFARSADLNTVSDTWQRGGEMDIMLRYWSDQPATYLRGVAYDLYEQGRWRSMPDQHEARREGSDRGRTIFSLGVPQTTTTLIGTIYPEAEVADVFFTPPGVHQLSAYAPEAHFSRAMTASPPGRQAGGGYGLFEPLAAAPPPQPADLEVPAELRPSLERFAGAIVSPDAPPDQQIDRLVGFFHDRFTYQLGLRLRPDRDPVLQFLEEIRAGHCEFFAASAALLLRTRGIPARYVTGFARNEPGGPGGLHLARRRDAHAWVEAYLPERGWIIVEATPPAARPQPLTPPAAQRWRELLAGYWDRLASIARYGGLMGLLGSAWHSLTRFLLAVPMAVWGLVILAGSLWITRRSWLPLLPGRRGAARALPPHVRELQAMLRQAERLAARHHLTRPDHMTPGRFLTLLAAADLPPDAKARACALLATYQARRFRPEVERPDGEVK